MPRLCHTPVGCSASWGGVCGDGDRRVIGVERVRRCPWRARCHPTSRGPCSGWARHALRHQGVRTKVADGSAAEGGSGDPDHGGRRRGLCTRWSSRQGEAVSYLRRESEADAGVFWHAGSVLALPEVGTPVPVLPASRAEEFDGDLTVPIASHVHRVASDGGRVLFAVDDGGVDGHRGGGEVEGGGVGEGEVEGTFLRIGEWDASGGLRTAQSVELERATWQHDIGVTAGHVVFIESPTTTIDGRRTPTPRCRSDGCPVPKAGWALSGAVPTERTVRWFRLDPCLVTHVLGAYEERHGRDGVVTGIAADARAGPIVLFVCCYGVPEVGQPVDLAASVVAAGGHRSDVDRREPGCPGALANRGGGHRANLVDERYVEYPRIDAACEAAAFRYGYALEMAWGDHSGDGGRFASRAARAGMPPGRAVEVRPGPRRVAAWDPGPGRTPSEPLFVRAADGRGDDEGWLLTVVDDADRGASDLYVLDASSMGRRRPEAVIHLPERLPLRSHGEWVPADRYTLTSGQIPIGGAFSRLRASSATVHVCAWHRPPPFETDPGPTPCRGEPRAWWRA